MTRRVPASEWDESGVSAAATAQTVTHTPPAAQSGSSRRSYVAGLLVQTSDGSRVGWNLDSPDGTLHIQGFTSDEAVEFDPALEMPPDAVVRLEVTAGAAGITTRANIWGWDQ